MAKEIMICLKPDVQDLCPQVLGPGNILDWRPADEENLSEGAEAGQATLPVACARHEKSKILSEQGQ